MLSYRRSQCFLGTNFNVPSRTPEPDDIIQTVNAAKTDILIELHVSDFEKVKEFYGRLGFEVVWERKPEGKKGYLVIKRGESILCFWPGTEEVYNQSYFKQFSKDTKRGYGVEIGIIVEDIESFYNQIKDSVKVVDELQVQPWGLKDFRIEDPFGFYLKLSEPYDILDKINAVE